MRIMPLTGWVGRAGFAYRADLTVSLVSPSDRTLIAPI
jgi:hypothetical protein